MSPKNLLTTTITDELRMGTNLKESHWYEFKDRGAIYQRVILQIGHFGTAKPGSFLFMVSSYRLGSKFNDEKHYMPYINSWDL
jgi:hypothetical protein